MSQSPRASAEQNQLSLAPEPGAARDARAWVTGVLARWPEESVETARLLLSELVTNSVLHAGTAIEVICRPESRRARFEVSDWCRSGPVPKRYARDSPTGRGIRLVASLSEEWGVQRERRGKTIWFVVSRTTRPPARFDAASPAAGLPVQLQEVTTPGNVVDAVEVRVLALPLDVYLEAEQHNDALIRELTLIVQSAESSGRAAVSRRLLELANAVRAAFSQASDGLRAQVEDAARRGQRTVDITMSVPRRGWEGLMRLADWLDEIDGHCEEGELLTLASSPGVRYFRSWFARQVADQMRGLPPSPWEETTSG
jgi:anti-sigma regulatory factor (Ser/Thr protein kinase)